MTKLEMVVKKALKKQDKEKLLGVWNRYQNDWVGIPFRYMTREQFYKEWGTNGRKMNAEKKWNRNLSDFNAKEKYVVVFNGGHYVTSVSRFFSARFVDLESEGFLQDIANYAYEFGLDDVAEVVKNFTSVK